MAAAETDDGIALDNKNVEEGSDALDASVSEANTDIGSTADPNSNVIEETVAVEDTGDGIALDNKKVEEVPDAPDASVSEANTASGNDAHPNADVIDETVAVENTDDGISLDNKKVEGPNVEDAVEDTSEESFKNKDVSGSEETKS